MEQRGHERSLCLQVYTSLKYVTPSGNDLHSKGLHASPNTTTRDWP